MDLRCVLVSFFQCVPLIHSLLFLIHQCLVLMWVYSFISLSWNDRLCECMSVCLRLLNTKNQIVKKTNSSCIATNTFNDHRAPHTNEHFNTFFVVILSLAFFVCMLVYLATRFGWYWIEVFFSSFHLPSAQAKTTILLKSQLHVYVPLVWFTYKIRFYDFRRMCLKCSALNMVERSLRFSVCITYMHYKHIASERLYFEHLQCLFTVEWQCIFSSGVMHRTEALWDHSLRIHSIQCTPITWMCLE